MHKQVKIVFFLTSLLVLLSFLSINSYTTLEKDGQTELSLEDSENLNIYEFDFVYSSTSFNYFFLECTFNDQVFTENKIIWNKTPTVSIPFPPPEFDLTIS